MDSLLWERAREIFDAALELPPNERPAFLKGVCRGDPSLRSEVESLLEADAKAASFLEAGWFSPVPNESNPLALRPDEMICDRYRILRRLGEGGSGEVYQAYDKDLGVPIALKTLRPDVALSPEIVGRFRQEVLIARRITHPNVCRTFHLEREVRPERKAAPELTFITMEYLDGETLQQKLRRDGAMPFDQALSIARQIAAALDAAHAVGIVHRDVKPGNIMLCDPLEVSAPNPRAVVTDFGLAKSRNAGELGDLSSHSLAGNAMGTLAYMSPEQVEAGETGTATDIYSFGLILYEMVTGQKAWPDVDSLASARQRLTDTPINPRTLKPALPQEWVSAIMACLRIAPETRYATAAAVLAAIEGSGPTPLLTPPPPRRPFAWKRLAILSAILCAIVSSFLLALRLYRSGSPTAPGTVVYLAPVVNRTVEKKLDNVTQLLRAGLDQSPQIRLLDAASDGDYLQKMARPPDTPIDPPIAREIAMRAGATRVILTTLTNDGADYRLDVELQQTDTTPLLFRNRWSKVLHWTGLEPAAAAQSGEKDVISPQMLAAIRDAADWVRIQIGESPRDLAQLNVAPGEVTTRSWKALTSYNEAQKLIAAGRKEEAISRFQEAIQHDPNFALAHAGLADNLISMQRLKEGYREYRLALDNDASERLSRKERDYIKGAYANDTRDYATALAAFRDESSFYENDFNAWFAQAYPLDMLDRPADAISVLQRADPLGASPHLVASQMAFDHLLLGDQAAARKQVQQLMDAKRSGMANLLSGIASFLAGDYQASHNFFAHEQNASDRFYRFMGYALAIRLLAEQGRYTEALEVSTQALDVLRSEKDHSEDTDLLWSDLGAIECSMGHFSKCLSDLTESLRSNSNPDQMLVVSTILGMAWQHLQQPERQDAVNLLLKMQGSLPSDDLGLIYALTRLRLQGELALTRNDPAAALAAFRKADTLDAPLLPREYLSRALLAVAATQRPVQARAAQQEALRIDSRDARRPAAIWYSPLHYPPGFAAYRMAAYLSLAALLHRDDREVNSTTASFYKLRPTPLTTVQ